MPLVRIDLIKQAEPERAKKIGALVYEAMRETINVPDRDNFQVLTEHEARHFV